MYLLLFSLPVIEVANSPNKQRERECVCVCVCVCDAGRLIEMSLYSE